ncbi:MAG: S-adenosylmethionine:tRNA ribosyltransferase-isomerase [Bacteroidia bacterium]|nr:S-adenosylmethionine:tRNA ribosyltransferase-isomerase [Bacteroidia bacterium]
MPTSDLGDFLPSLNIADYNYELPEDRIASFPVKPKDASALLIYRQGEIEHKSFVNIHNYLPNSTLLVFNNTKVIPARLLCLSSAGHKIEVFLLKPLNENWDVWEVLVGNRRKFKENDIITVSNTNQPGTNLMVQWANRDQNTVRLTSTSELSIIEIVEQLGQIPLPPYIKREVVSEDNSDYQTIFAKNLGAVAAPTASLHFTDRVIDNLNSKGISHSFITLHVGLGTFKPVTSVTTSDHDMHSEDFVITIEFINQLIESLSNPVIPVGTTSMRVLESIFYAGARLLLSTPNPFKIPRDVSFNPAYSEITTLNALTALKEYAANQQGVIQGSTSIFILPGFKFRFSKGLITNFHQPGSTLILLVAALLGPNWRKVYQSALQNNYRFLSYGDSSLLLP